MALLRPLLVRANGKTRGSLLSTLPCFFFLFNPSLDDAAIHILQFQVGLNYIYQVPTSCITSLVAAYQPSTPVSSYSRPCRYIRLN